MNILSNVISKPHSKYFSVKTVFCFSWTIYFVRTMMSQTLLINHGRYGLGEWGNPHTTAVSCPQKARQPYRLIGKIRPSCQSTDLLVLFEKLKWYTKNLKNESILTTNRVAFCYKKSVRVFLNDDLNINTICFMSHSHVRKAAVGIEWLQCFQTVIASRLN